MDAVLKSITKYYLSVTADKEYLSKLLTSPLLQPLSEETQNEILSVTVKNGIVVKYPPPISYKKYFLRQLIQVIESNNIEVGEELLLSYTDILKQTTTKDPFFYCTYLLNNSSAITLQENRNFVTNGTTGLKTWEASKLMVEWCRENASLFKNRRVLELGSGTGFMGLCIMKCCQPSAYIFTDKSEEVLKLVSLNLQINFKDDEENSWKARSEIHYLNWSELTLDDVDNFKSDIVIGADIVFDPLCIGDLVRSISLFLHSGASCAYIANTVRNEQTDQTFRDELSARDLSYEMLQFQGNRTLLFSGGHFNIYRIFKKMINK